MLLYPSLSTEDEEGPGQRSHLSVDMAVIKWPGRPPSGEEHNLWPQTYTPDFLLIPKSNVESSF